MKIFYLIFMMCCGVFWAHAGEGEGCKSTKARPLIMLIDNWEAAQGLGSITNAALAALYQKAGPVLMSMSLVRTILTGTVDDKMYEDWYKRVCGCVESNLSVGGSKLYALCDAVLQGSQPLVKGRDRFYIEKFIIATVARSIKEDDWFIGHANESLALFVPRVLISEREKSASGKGYTLREYDLGLKIDHMKEYTLQELITYLKGYKKPDDTGYVMHALWDPKKKESPLFITRAEYHNEAYVPRWIIYLDGHGVPHTYLASLPIKDFRDLLTLCTRHLVTDACIISSCYAMGVNLHAAYSDMHNPRIMTTYPYPIVTEGVTDIISYHHAYVDLACKAGGELSLRFSYNLGDFCHNVCRVFNDKRNLEQIRALSATTFDTSPDLFANNYVMVRPAECEFFIPLRPGVECGAVMAATCSESRPIDVVARARLRQPQGSVHERTAVFVSVRDVPCTLLFKGEKRAPSLLSTIPGESVQTINRIIADYALEDIVESARVAYGMRKIFHIRECVCSKPKKTTWRDVIIDSKENVTKCFMTNERGVGLELPGVYALNYMKTYQPLLDQAEATPRGLSITREQVSAIEQAEQKKHKSRAVPAVSEKPTPMQTRAMTRAVQRQTRSMTRVRNPKRKHHEVDE